MENNTEFTITFLLFIALLGVIKWTSDGHILVSRWLSHLNSSCNCVSLPSGRSKPSAIDTDCPGNINWLSIIPKMACCPFKFSNANLAASLGYMLGFVQNETLPWQRLLEFRQFTPTTLARKINYWWWPFSEESFILNWYVLFTLHFFDNLWGVLQRFINWHANFSRIYSAMDLCWVKK